MKPHPLAITLRVPNQSLNYFTYPVQTMEPKYPLEPFLSRCHLTQDTCRYRFVIQDIAYKSIGIFSKTKKKDLICKPFLSGLVPGPDKSGLERIHCVFVYIHCIIYYNDPVLTARTNDILDDIFVCSTT